MIYRSTINFLMLGLIATMLIAGCKKKKEDAEPQPVSSTSSGTSTTSSTGSTTSGSTTSSGPAPCTLYTTISADPNYIPHRKNNGWNYCTGNSIVSFRAYIVKDTLINSLMCFDVKHEPNQSQVLGGRFTEKWFIDQAGKYYVLNERTSGYQDTILVIKPGALNGDTIYKYAPNQVNVVLINDNETIGTLTGCYHIREIHFNSASDRYFRKGIGELYLSNTPFLLQNATIH